MVSKYDTHVAPRLNEIQAWARDGATEEEIAKFLGIAYSTFRLHKKKHSALSAALKPAQQYDDEVVNALHRNTIGQVVKLQKPIKVRKKFFEGGKLVREEEVVVTAEEEIYVHPDTMAQMYWLNNRQPSKWRQKAKEQPNQADLELDGKQKDELYEVLIGRTVEGFNDEQDDLHG